jgi:transposase-like protein
MGSIYHANAKTTVRIRKEIQESKESIATLAKIYRLNPKTIAKWRKSEVSEDRRSGPKKPKSALSEREQQVICEVRRVTQFSLDDLFIALEGKIPTLTRSNLHRCLVRHGLNVLPKDPEKKTEKQKFKEYEVGYVHVDITQIVLSGGQKFYLFVGICRVSKYAYVELHDNMTKETACVFLKNLIGACSFKIHRILTDNGAQFTYALLAEHLKPKDKIHPFDKMCEENNIIHKLTKFKHPWTNGQVEIFNKTIKNATVKQYHYDDIDQLKQHLMAYLMVHNYQKKLKSLKFQTPYDFLLLSYQNQPHLFKENPNHKLVGLNS